MTLETIDYNYRCGIVGSDFLSKSATQQKIRASGNTQNAGRDIPTAKLVAILGANEELVGRWSAIGARKGRPAVG
uniref:Uncharacterized protein n=1 Tax=Citrifermentans bremense TaxID=60035 RepID=A0A6S6M3P3_9BACT